MDVFAFYTHAQQLVVISCMKIDESVSLTCWSKVFVTLVAKIILKIVDHILSDLIILATRRRADRTNEVFRFRTVNSF